MAEAANARCLACGGAGRDAFPKGDRAYLRCRACDTLFLSPQPTAAELDAYYASGDFYGGALAQAEAQRRRARSRLRRLASLTPGRTLLDVGCAAGIFLDESRAAGWDAHGFERSPALAGQAAAKGFDVVCGADLSAIAGKTYDAVTLWEVIEHVSAPGQFLRQAARLLSPGGVLALSTPNGGGLLARAMGPRFPFAIVPEHIALYSRPALLQMLESSGLRPARELTFSGIDRAQARASLSRRGGAIAATAAPALATLFGVIDKLRQGTELEVYARR